MANKIINIQTKTGFLGIHVSFWIVIFNLGIYFMALVAHGSYVYQRTLVLLAVNVLLFYACYSWIVPAYIQKKKFKTAIGLILILVIVISVLRTAGDRLLLNKFNWEPIYNFPQRGRIVLMFLGETALAAFAILIRLAVDSFENKR
ncbi:MAG: hypothetical protein ACYC25_07110, partial [Paludibacter sp.]